MLNETSTSSALSAEDLDFRQEAPQDDVITLLDQVTRQHPHRDAVESMHQKGLLGIGNVRWSFAQLQEASVKLAASLSTVGVQRGARVAAFLFNQAEWPLVFLATLRLGAHFVPLDPRMLSRQDDARYILEKVEARHIFVSDKSMSSAVDSILAHNLEESIFKCIVSPTKGTDLPSGWITLPQLMETVPESSPPITHLAPNDIILLLCTSGTTSRPKVCPHTSITIATPALALADHFGITPNQPICQHLPSFHVFSVVMTLAFWLSGATVIFPSISFDAAASFNALKSNSQTHMPCVPAMAQAMKAYALSQDHPLPAPYHIILGGTSISPDMVDVCKAFGTQRITAGYGMTEGVATLIHAMGSSQSDVVDGYVCLGRAIAGANLRMCRFGTRDTVQRGEIGELHQGGPPVISGYLGATIEDNACCYSKDGVNWCATGDQGYMDSQGRVYLLGRYKDLIIRGGENISPAKIEQCLLKFPHIHVSTFHIHTTYFHLFNYVLMLTFK
ncbi:AMP-binding enzyme family protein [Penicillium verhagenii]|nr:AMP-binding enzyme family protein [Penicillium verhagenii]